VQEPSKIEKEDLNIQPKAPKSGVLTNMGKINKPTP
jgi:hypothetical protein